MCVFLLFVNFCCPGGIVVFFVDFSCPDSVVMCVFLLFVNFCCPGGIVMCVFLSVCRLLLAKWHCFCFCFFL